MLLYNIKQCNPQIFQLYRPIEATFLVVFGVDMNILFIVKVRVFWFVTLAYILGFPDLC